MDKEKKELSKLLKDFMKGKILKRSKRIGELAEKVAEQMCLRKDEDLDNWAENLSIDVSKLAD